MSAIAEPPHMAHTAAQVFHCQNSCLNCSCSAAAGQQRTSRPGRRADGPTDQPTGLRGQPSPPSKSVKHFNFFKHIATPAAARGR